MEIKFNATTLDGSTLIETEQKRYWEQIIIQLVNEFSKQLETSKLKYIIIPENYKVELFEYQEKIGQRQWCTDDDTGRGVAQVITESLGMKKSYVIFISKEIIFAMYDDICLGEAKKVMTNEEFENLFKFRNLAINTLHHELAHIHEENITSGIKWIHRLDENSNSITQQLRNFGMVLWREYYACRTSATTRLVSESDITSIISLCKKIESEIALKRREYNFRELSLDDFVGFLHQNINSLLKFSTYAYGNFYSLDYQTNHELINIVKHSLDKTLFHDCWIELGLALNKLFEQYPNWNNIEVLDGLVKVVLKYIGKFNITISDTDRGIYYDIPVDKDLL